jgi:hypothetical protein
MSNVFTADSGRSTSSVASKAALLGTSATSGVCVPVVAATKLVDTSARGTFVASGGTVNIPIDCVPMRNRTMAVPASGRPRTATRTRGSLAMR